MDHLARQLLSTRVRQELDSLLISGDGLDTVCLGVELTLSHIVAVAVIQAVSDEARSRGLSSVTGAFPVFSLNGKVYEVHAQPASDDVATYTVVVRFEGEELQDLEAENAPEYPVESVGRFNCVRILTVPDFVFSSIVGEAAVVAMEVSYEWLFEFVSGRLGELSSKGPERLYGHLRRLMPKLADQVWLYTIVDGKGFYIADSVGQKAILRKFAARRHPSVVSPAHLWGKFSEQAIPFDLLFSKEAFKTEKGLPAFFDIAKYAPTGLGSAEKRVYDSDGIIAQPLVTEGRGVQLGVGYPLEIQNEVQEVLYQASPQFKQIVDTSHDSLAHRVGELARLAEGQEGLAEELLALVEAKPGFFGFAVDLKELFRILKRLLKGKS